MIRTQIPVGIGIIVWLTASAPMSADDKPADLVLRGGTILTVINQDETPTALAVTGNRIVAVGFDADIAARIGPKTRVIELQGRTAMPGFIESHGHLLSLGRLRMDVDLSRAKSWDEIVKLISERTKTVKPGEWIVGRGWHQEKWARPAQANDDRYPIHTELSAATPDNPVLLIHGTGHMAAANSAAMRAAGITRESGPPAGGEILRDANGNPTGVFRETAQAPLEAAYEKWRDLRTDEQKLADEGRAFELATAECLVKGVTSFQDAGSSFADVDLFRHLADEGRMPIRLWVMLNEGPDALAEKMARYRMIDYRDRLTVRAIKCMADGALGSHGALLLEPYDDLPESTGLRVQSMDRIRRTGLLALEHDYQLCTHAIGDRANREVLDLYEELLRSRPRSDLRWRIEHVQHIDPGDMPRFAGLDVIASMQANHATSDGPFVVTRLGEKRTRVGAYAWRSLLDAGARIANGTDVPVEDVDPLACLYSAVTRRMPNGGEFFPEQRMTRAEALRSYTVDAAYAAFEDNGKGSLEPKKLADIVVLSGNPLTVNAEGISKLRVEMTIVDGKVIYDMSK